MVEYITMQLERRMPYRRVIKTSMEKIFSKWAKWVKIQIAGRLNGAEMARKETFKVWRIPLQTLRTDIDYYYATAVTKYGILWVKVWIYKGDIDDNKKKILKSTKKKTKKTYNKSRVLKSKK
jgi:small subunit ribosomal protein S3